jgi:hypothetical protein
MAGHGPRRFDAFRIQAETTWGTAPTGTWTTIAPDEYTVEPENEMTLQEKFDGQIDPVYLDFGAQNLTGSMTIQAWPDIISLLLDIAGLPRDSNAEVKSYTVQARSKTRTAKEWIQHTGLRCDRCRIEARGNEPVRFTFDFIGKKETTVASFTPGALPSQLPFRMGHIGTAGFKIVTASEDPSSTGTGEPNINSISLEIANNLVGSDGRESDGTLRFLDSGAREGSGSFVVSVRTDMALHYRDAVRSALTNIGIDIQFDYPGTGSPADTFGLEYGKCGFQSARRTGGPSDPETWEISFLAGRPASQAAILSRIDGVNRNEPATP